MCRHQQTGILSSLLFLGGVALSASTQAASFAGFASLGIGKLNREGVKVVDYDDQWSARTDSVLGGQVNHSFTGRTAFTGQALIRRDLGDPNLDFAPALDWLFVSHQASARARFRAGRMRTPLFLHSESLSVGYAYTWARPPIDVYHPVLTATSNFDGIDVNLASDFHDWEVESTFYAGRTNSNSVSTEIDVKRMIGATLQLRGAQMLWRYSTLYSKINQTISTFDTLALSLRAFAPADPTFAEIANSYTLTGEWYNYHALGAQWDTSYWTFSGEINRVSAPGNGLGTNIRGWYLSASKQVRNLRPYITAGHSAFYLNSETYALLNSTYNTIPVGANTLLDQVRVGALSAYKAIESDGYSITLGLRADIHDQAAVKVEVQYFESGTPLTSFDDNALKDRSLVLTTCVLEVLF